MLIRLSVPAVLRLDWLDVNLNMFFFSGSLSCLWHLLGEGCTLVHPLDGSKVQVAVPGKLMSTGQCCSENFVVLDKVEVQCDELHLRKIFETNFCHKVFGFVIPVFCYCVFIV